MLSKPARELIFENKANFDRSKNAPAAPLSREEIRRCEYDAAKSLSSVYANTDVTTKDFGGTPTDVMIPRPIERKDVFFYIHGGAWAFGSAMNARLTAAAFTEYAKAIAVCPDYRLAPEHKFSVLLDDCLTSYIAACNRYGGENIVLAGSSAGGNLALALMQKLRESGMVYPKAMILFSPVTMVDNSKDSRTCLSDWDIVLRGYDDNLIATYGDRPEDYKNKYMSPLYGEYEGFPPMYICCGSEEILLDDSFLLFKKAKKAGVKAVLSVRAGMWHSYPECHHFIPEGKEEILNALSFLDDINSGTSTL